MAGKESVKPSEGGLQQALLGEVDPFGIALAFNGTGEEGEYPSCESCQSTLSTAGRKPHFVHKKLSFSGKTITFSENGGKHRRQ
ncbi:hypothetical protein [Ruegeria sp. HKCCD6157]|uniref:hypothetical protein n=1 Tax=Ruegeria sp. HKCCD6157 TaxID=2690707 RepID=UPI0014924023|nr:hypothetical protein [Ruegeria sp. HKCCD6157]NOE26699.1 hypothetical protein [Ruegeria sp. HKCCD6157]